MIIECPSCGTENNLPDTKEQRKQYYRQDTKCCQCGRVIIDASEVRNRAIKKIQANQEERQKDERREYRKFAYAFFFFMPLLFLSGFLPAYFATGFWIFLVIMGVVIPILWLFGLMYWFSSTK